jgi:hypothetical protein
MVTTIIVGVVALVVGFIGGALVTQNNVKRVQSTVDYFEGLYHDVATELQDAYSKIADRDKRISELEKPNVAKTAKVKKAAS